MSVVVVGLSGCSPASGGSFQIIRGGINTTPNSIEGAYDYYTGYYFKEAILEAGDVLLFELDVTTLDGQFSVRVENSSGEKISAIGKESELVIESPGVYRVVTEAKGHQGAFSLTWEVK